MEDLVHGLLAAHQLFRLPNLQRHLIVLPHLRQTVGDGKLYLLRQHLQIFRIAHIEVQVVVIYRFLPLIYIMLPGIVLAVQLLDDTVGGVDGQALGRPGAGGIGGIKHVAQAPPLMDQLVDHDLTGAAALLRIT